MNKQFRAGIRSSVPACLGVIPVAMSFGLLAIQAGLSDIEAIFMSLMVMAGAAQLMAVSMITDGAAISAIILSTFFINLRHIVMSSSVMQQLKNSSLPERLLGSFALCDESFAIYSLSRDESYAFLLGANTALYGTFVLSTVVGCLMSNILPQIVMNSFGIAFYAAFLGLLLPCVKHNIRLIALVLITAALNWLLQCFLPASWSVILSMMSGALMGVFLVEDETAQKQ